MSDATLTTIETFDAKVRADTKTLDMLYNIKGLIQSKLSHRKHALNLEDVLLCKCYIDDDKSTTHRLTLSVFETGACKSPG